MEVVGTLVDVELFKIVMLELGEGVEDISGLIEVVGANTVLVLVDSDIEIEFVGCGMTVGVTVEVVTDVVEGGTVVGEIIVVVNGITVDVGLEIKVVEGSGVSHKWYSQCIENGPASITNACSINSKHLMTK